MTESSTDPALVARLSRVRLYVVTDAEQTPALVLETVAAACAGGADAVQLRRKGGDDLETLRLAEACREVTAAAGALFIVDDRLDVAMAVGADGVHVGQADLPAPLARRLWPDGVIGVSTHSLSQAVAAEAAGADYIGVGPVYATPTKPGRPAVGLGLVAEVAAAVRLPWVAIGGIDAGTVGGVLDAGARRIAVVRAVCAAGDPEAAARELRRLVEARAGAGAAA